MHDYVRYGRASLKMSSYTHVKLQVYMIKSEWDNFKSIAAGLRVRILSPLVSGVGPGWRFLWGCERLAISIARAKVCTVYRCTAVQCTQSTRQNYCELLGRTRVICSRWNDCQLQRSRSISVAEPRLRRLEAEAALPLLPLAPILSFRSDILHSPPIQIQ